MRPHRFYRPALLPAALTVLTAIGGCAKCPETFVPIGQLVGEYNANAAAVERLWARAKLAVTIDRDGVPYTWGSTSPLASPNGLLLLSKGPQRTGPHNFVLIGRETAAVELFRLGSNVDEGVYYLWYRLGQTGGVWWGRQQFAGAPGIQALPIDPNQLIAVLGICDLPERFDAPPTVCMAMDATPGKCAYVLTYIDRQPITGNILFRREMYFRWSDTEPRRAFKVNLFDNDGRCVMTARLDKYEPIDSPEAPAGDQMPVMPTDIELEWIAWPGRPAVIRSIHLVLSEMTTAERGDPQAASRLQANLPTGLPTTQVDADVIPGGPSQ